MRSVMSLQITLFYEGHTHPIKLPLKFDGPPRRCWRQALAYVDAYIAPHQVSFTLLGPPHSVSYHEGVPDSYDLAALAVALEARKASLLIVDDEPAIVRLLRHFLKEYYTVISASSFDAALSVAETRLVDGFVLDLRLGGRRTGADLLRELRTWPDYEQAPAVVCTAFWHEVAGFDNVIQKPFTEGAVLNAVTEAFVRVRNREEPGRHRHEVRWSGVQVSS